MKDFPTQKHIQKSIDFVVQNRSLREMNWRPCSKRSLQELENKLEVELPLAFKEYWETLGNTDQQMIFGRDAEMGLLSDVLRPEPWETEEVVEYEAFLRKLKNKPAFCFSSHEGYAYDWFYLTPGDENPECFITTDLDKIKSNGTFSEYLFVSLLNFSKLLSG